MQFSAERRERIAAGWRAFLDRPDVKRALKIARRVLLAVIVAYLFYKLSTVGWMDVVNSLPTSPWFYVIFVLRYLSLPLTEIPAYELVWRRPLWRHFTAFIRKRVYNFAVMGYSGEAFFTLWARRALAVSDRDILIGVKDNNILSALVSNVATVILIVVLAASDNLKNGLDALPGSVVLFSLAFLSAFSLAAAVIVFRNKIIHLPDGMMPRLILIHGARMVLIIVLHATLYMSALPGAPLMSWLMFVALQLVLSRIPFVPNQDLLFLTAALHLAPIVDQPEAAIAGMLVAEAGLSQLVNFGLFFATAHHARDGERAPSGEDKP